MSQPKTRRWEPSERPWSGLSLRNALLAVAAVLLILAAGARAQQSLGDLVAEYGYDWMMGRWAAETDEGQKFELLYKWELDKHAVSVHFKGGDYEYRGLIFYLTATEQVVQVGADNKGGSGKGLWEPEGDRAVVRLKHTGPDGEIGKMAIAHSKVDAKTMKAEMYAVQDTGEPADEPWGTLEYKRRKRQPRKKAVDKAGDASKPKRSKKARQ